MDNGLVLWNLKIQTISTQQVLILIVVDNGLVPYTPFPNQLCNPVLILIVVDNGLVPNDALHIKENPKKVLILIVVDNGLVRQEAIRNLFVGCVS